MKRTPLQGQIEITNICNFKCVHCYVINGHIEKCFLPYDVIQSAIDEICEMGCEMLTITGGECILHPEFEKIYLYIWKRGIKVNIFTNASLIKEGTVRLFKEYMPNCVEASIYGASVSTYREVTRTEGFYDVINGLNLLQSNNIKLQLKLILLKQNQHELEEMKKLACKYTSKIRLANDLMPSYDFSPEVLKNHSTISIKSATVKNSTNVKNGAFRCHAGTSFFCISADGNVSLCSFCSFSEMSIKKYKFHEIWRKFNPELQIPKESECYNCFFLDECINCPARTWMFIKKIGLYPIPQCKKKGGFFMEKTSKELRTESFVTVNGITYFRLENGNIAVERPDKIIIDASRDEKVELINCGEEEVVSFWKINDTIYALTSSSNVSIPDVEFVDSFSTKSYPEGRYVKYQSKGKEGILYISETEIYNLVSSGYTELFFSDGVFYAKENPDKYHIIGESGNLIRTFPSFTRKLDGYMLFYNKDSIFIDSQKIDVPGGVSSVEIIKEKFKKLTFVKVLNANGIYFYTKNLELLFGPVNNYVIDYNHFEESCIIHDIEGEKMIKNVFFVKMYTDKYVCKVLSSPEEGVVPVEGNYKDRLFQVKNDLYELQNDEFTPIISGVNVERYLASYAKAWGNTNQINIFGLRDSKFVFHATYILGDPGTVEGQSLEQIWEEDDYCICRRGNDIMVIKSGRILFSEQGYSCFRKKYNEEDVFIVEKDENTIVLYKENGIEVRI